MKNNLTDMMCLDVYLSSLNKEKYNEVKALLQPSTKQNVNLLSWGIHDLFYNKKTKDDINTLQVLASNFNWKNEIAEILNENPYESLVITNVSKKIIWVSDGFKKMTGYDKEYALQKTASFLQGKETSEATKSSIRKKILANKPFKEVIINYRKDKSAYKCELNVFPLFSKKGTTHFLALEREVA